jgi:hypothetical protein
MRPVPKRCRMFDDLPHPGTLLTERVNRLPCFGNIQRWDRSDGQSNNPRAWKVASSARGRRRGENSPNNSRIEPPNCSSRRKKALTSCFRNRMSLLTSAATRFIWRAVAPTIHTFFPFGRTAWSASRNELFRSDSVAKRSRPLSVPNSLPGGTYANCGTSKPLRYSRFRCWLASRSLKCSVLGSNSSERPRRKAMLPSWQCTQE